MSKVTGLGMAVAVDDSGGTPQTISGDVNDVQFGTPRGLQTITGLDKSGVERLLLLADGHVTLKGTFNADAGKSHAVFGSVTTCGVARTCRVTLPGGAYMAMELLFSTYTIVRGPDGSLTWTATGDLADGTVPTWA
jgi:hypothetical protein